MVNTTAQIGDAIGTATAVAPAAFLRACVTLGLALRLTDRGLRLIQS